ncbi:MAG TPA: hypothetical protein VM616_06340, partial [Gammaproteobacteria bacterium]|nr:hypothetical protein [Gammaproteobacteria bacterium]
AAQQRARGGQFTRQDATTLVRGTRPGTRAPSKAELKRKLERTGSMDDAYEFLKASRSVAR